MGAATQIDNLSYYTTAAKAIDGNTYGIYTGYSSNKISVTKSHIRGEKFHGGKKLRHLSICVDF